MPSPLPQEVVDLLSVQSGVATASQLIAIGFSERRIATAVRHQHLVRIHRGAYVQFDRWRRATTTARHCLQLYAVQLAATDAVAWGPTAAVAWSLPIRSVPALPMVARPATSGQAVAGALVTRSRTTVASPVNRHGLLVTNLALTVVDVVSVLGFRDGLMTVDGAQRRGVSLADLLEVAGERAPNRGRAKLVAAVQAGDPCSESGLESLSRASVILSGRPVPLCNVVLICNGRVYRVDLLWVELGVVGECDGKTKYSDPNDVTEVLWREKRRHQEIEEWGFRVARWGYHEVADADDAMLRRIDQAIGVQQRLGFTWPTHVRAEVRAPRGVSLPPRVVTEVLRLERLGYPIAISDEWDSPWPP
ncbi:MAG: type IV toxin-antitoxin system AbiEi family antitoxin domain-containing protein [Actinomycetes bacterium]